MCMTHVGGPETIVEIENRERQEGAAAPGGPSGFLPQRGTVQLTIYSTAVGVARRETCVGGSSAGTQNHVTAAQNGQ